MMRRNRSSYFAFLLAGLALVAVPALQAEIYKIVDKDGNVIFTDVPPKENSDTYSVNPGSSYQPPVTDQPATTGEQLGANFESGEDPDATVTPAYASIDITFPAEDQAVRQNSGTVTFSIAIDPALHGDDQVQLSVDGQIKQKAAATAFTVEHMDRGTHVVQVSIIDGDGSVVLSSTPRTFHLLRYSAIN